MRTIIITGKQGSGKTELVRLITDGKSCVFITSALSHREADEETKFIVFEDIGSEKELAFFKQLSTSTKISVRKPYNKNLVEIDCSNITLIGTSSSIEKFELARHGFVYNLS